MDSPRPTLATASGYRARLKALPDLYRNSSAPVITTPARNGIRHSAGASAMATVNDPRFDDYANDPSERQPRNWVVTCLVGCLIVVVVLLVLGAIVAYWVSQNWRGWVSTAGAQ